MVKDADTSSLMAAPSSIDAKLENCIVFAAAGWRILFLKNWVRRRSVVVVVVVVVCLLLTDEPKIGKVDQSINQSDVCVCVCVCIFRR